MLRTLEEIATGDTVLTQSDNDLRLALERTELPAEMPAEMQRALLELQPAARARSRVIAAKLVEMMGGPGQ